MAERVTSTSPLGEGSADVRMMHPLKVEAVLKEAEKRARLDEERARGLQFLTQVIKYALAIQTSLFRDQKIEQELIIKDNPLEWTLRVYWKGEKEEKLFDEKQRKLTDFL